MNKYCAYDILRRDRLQLAAGHGFNPWSRSLRCSLWPTKDPSKRNCKCTESKFKKGKSKGEGEAWRWKYTARTASPTWTCSLCAFSSSSSSSGIFCSLFHCGYPALAFLSFLLLYSLDYALRLGSIGFGINRSCVVICAKHKYYLHSVLEIKQ